MRKLILALMLSVFLLGFGATAMADTILFPYLNTDAGVYSFVTIVNDGLAENATIAGYHYIYGYKANPIVNRAACLHADGPGLTTPADMVSFEVNCKVTDGGNCVLAENAGDVPPGPGPTSTAYILTVAGATAFMIVEPVGIGVEADDDVMRLWGWADIIDTANNMTLAYSTRDFSNDFVGGSFENTGAEWTSISWWPVSHVTSSWYLLPLGTALEMSPPAAGGLRRAFLAWDGDPVRVGAYDRDEHFFSGGLRPLVRCMGMVTRTDLFTANPIQFTQAGGWAYLGLADIDVLTNAADPIDPLAIYLGFDPAAIDWPRPYLAHKVQTATAATGFAPRTSVVREPTWDGFPYAP